MKTLRLWVLVLVVGAVTPGFVATGCAGGESGSDDDRSDDDDDDEKKKKKKKDKKDKKDGDEGEAAHADEGPGPGDEGGPGSAVSLAPAHSAGPGPLVVTPKIPKPERGMMDHAYVSGWTADGSRFGYCVENGGTGGRDCTLIAADGTSESLSDFDPDRGEPVAKMTRELASKLEELGLGAAGESWPYGDLTVTWKVTRKAPISLSAGARMGDAPPAFPVKLAAPDEDDLWFMHPESIALSPDGTRLAVLSHAFAGEYSDTFAVSVVPVGRIAAGAYNRAGFQAHKKEDFAASAELFARAHAADPELEVAVYNLACAHARNGDARAEEALRRAIELGGDKTKAKSMKDADLESVRSASWFTELMK